ncbi:hypothetical protein ACF0H5_003765 [Mactra antiquata]
MKTTLFLLFLTVLGMTSGGGLLHLMEQGGVIHLPAGYQVISENYIPASEVHMLGIDGTHEYTFMIDGKTCELTTVTSTASHGFFLAMLQNEFEVTKDTCGLSA